MACSFLVLRSACRVAAALVLVGLAAVSAAVVNVACVGDDITLAPGIPLPYPVVLQTFVGTGLKVTSYGANSATVMTENGSPFVSSAQYTASRTAAPDVVIIMLGTYDSQPGSWPFLPNFAGEYATLVNGYTNLPNHPQVFCCLPPPAYPNLLGIYDDHLTSAVIPGIQQEASKLGLPVIDVRSAMLPFPTDTTNGVDPDAYGCRVIAGTVYRALQGAGYVSPPATPLSITSFTAGPTLNTSSSSTITFTVVFNRALLTFNLAALQLQNAGAPILNTKDYITYTITVTPTAVGQIGVTIPAGAATDVAGDSNVAATATTTYTGRGIATHPSCGAGSGLGALLMMLMLGLRHRRRRPAAGKAAP